MADWIYYAIVIIAALIAIAVTQPRAPKQKRPTLEDFAIPRANQGDPIPVPFGVITVTGPMVVWYGDLEVETETEDHIKTRKFYLGLHFIICHGPINYFIKILAGERLAWEDQLTESGTFLIDNGSLFGGKRLQGGIYGYVDLMMGEADQVANAYLTGKQPGVPQPGYRGVVSVVPNHCYVSANATSIGPWAFKIARYEAGWYNECWYPETVRVGALSIFSSEGSLLYAPLNDPNIDQPYGSGGSSEIIHISYGQQGVISTAESLYYATSGPHVRSSPTLFGEPALQIEDNSIGTFLNSTQGGYTSAPDVTSAAYLGMFFPEGRGQIKVQFCCTNIGSTEGGEDGTKEFILSCGLATPATPTNDLRAWDIRLAAYNLIDLAGAHLEFVWFTGDGPLDYDFLEGHTRIENGEQHKVEIRMYDADGFYDLRQPAEIAKANTIWMYLDDGVEDSSGFGANAIRPLVDPDNPAYIKAGLVNSYAASGFAGQINQVLIGTDIGSDDNYPDMNPAHIIYQALTDPIWGMGYPTSFIDDASFRAAALTFYNEGMGLSLQWVKQEKIEDFIQHICDHAACVWRTSPRTGKFNLKPIRGDYDVSTLPVLNEDNIVEVESWQRVGYGELVGEVVITYRDKDTNKDGSVTLQNLAVIQSQQGIVSDSIEFPGISNQLLAQRVAMRELKARSVPLAAGKIKCNRSVWEAQSGDVYKLSWAKLGLTEVVVRVATVNTGSLKDGVITLEVLEDVFGMPDSTYAASQGTAWTDPGTAPEIPDTGDAESATVSEAPYWWLMQTLSPSDFALMKYGKAGYLLPMIARPFNSADGYDYHDECPMEGNTLSTKVVDGAFDPFCRPTTDIARNQTVIPIQSPVMMSSLTVPCLAHISIIGSTTDNDEWWLVTAIDLDAMEIIVERGMLDTTPQDTFDEDSPIFFFPIINQEDTYYYQPNLQGIDGDAVTYGFDIRSGSGIDTDAFTGITYNVCRALRPLNVGHVRINSEDYPFVVSADIRVSWKHRNRLTQTTLVTQNDATNYPPEDGTSFQVYLSHTVAAESGPFLIDSFSGLTGSDTEVTFADVDVEDGTTLFVTIRSDREDDDPDDDEPFAVPRECWERQVREFTYQANLYRMTEESNWRRTEDNEYREWEEYSNG